MVLLPTLRQVFALAGAIFCLREGSLTFYTRQFDFLRETASAITAISVIHDNK